jgi:hypothetical protein
VLFKHFGFTPENVADTVLVSGAAPEGAKKARRGSTCPAVFESQPKELTNHHGDQDWHQRLRPHRPQRAAQRRSRTSDIEVVGINDLLEPDYLAYMLQYDSVHGRFKGTVAVEGNTLIVNGKKIRLTPRSDPANLKWGEVGADVVIESTGLFLDKEAAQKHLDAGAKKVIMSPPARTTRPCSCSA